MSGRSIQSFFMLLLTIAVGMVFIIRTNPRDQEIAVLETQNASLRTQIAFIQIPPTATRGFRPTLAATNTIDPLLPTVEGIPSATIDPLLPTIEATLPSGSVEGIPAFPTTAAPASQGPAIISVEASLEADVNGCAVNPRTVFTNFETIYGVGRFAGMRSGDQITVRFFYNDTSALIYEDSFTVAIAGDFCRWYTVEPDELGWDIGSYSIAYQINEQPPSTLDYTVGVLTSTSEP